MSFVLPILALSGTLSLIGNSTGSINEYAVRTTSTWDYYNSYRNYFEDNDLYSNITLRINGCIGFNNVNTNSDLYIIGGYSRTLESGYKGYDDIYNSNIVYDKTTLVLDDFTNDINNGYNIGQQIYYQSFTCEITFTNMQEYYQQVSTGSWYFYVGFKAEGVSNGIYDYDITSMNLVSYNNDYTSYTGGYEVGYDKGYDTGYEVGFNDGQNQGSELFTLITAVPDSFVSSFRTIFNFEIFGVNIFNFMVSVISIGLVIFIIKKVAS